MPGLNRDQLNALIPHDAAMCLLDHVVDWDEDGIHCRSGLLQPAQAHPLARDGHVAAVHIIEYAAQAAAVHSGLVANETTDQRPRGGFLAALRDVEWAEHALDPITLPLEVRVFREMGGPQGMIYQFEVADGGEKRSSGRLTIVAKAGC